MIRIRSKFEKIDFTLLTVTESNSVVPAVLILSTGDFGLTVPEVFRMIVLDAASREDDSRNCEIPFPAHGTSVVVTLNHQDNHIRPSGSLSADSFGFSSGGV